ncbi:type II secretory pathway component PulD-like protein [Halodesulfovibrio sp.]|jgi:type IVB pilus formation R64 PilN family outer membrane protein|uniref:type II secretory pathway component PulD-like protein n=1 Tax=Halodesulfovibrio sp. TaxID=1912772 RepID=UPI0025FCABC6|nr:type II secretory pathway component PulD-like protein [Halodesulfovibrio sp.]MCT4625657.1 type II secretory pathway component PulD-like protein [Halodesulfovibrio sp.]
MKKISFLVLSIVLLGCTAFLGGCALNSASAPQTRIQTQAQQVKLNVQPQTVNVVHQAYLGADPVELKGAGLPSLFEQRITLRRSGTLPQLINAIQELVPLGIKYSTDNTAAGDAESTSAKADTMTLTYSGTVENLFNTIGQHFGQSWEYRNGVVEFSYLRVKTFTLFTSPSEIGYEGVITNKTEARSDESSGSSSQTAQTSKNRYKADMWVECKTGIESMLSKRGSVSMSKASGTITVTDTAPVLDRIEKYISSINAKLGKQVALSVHVWSLEMSDTTDAGLNLKALLETSGVNVVSSVVNPYQLVEGASTLTATILGNGILSGSEAVLRALKQNGRTTLLTSGSGISMNNQILPVQVDRRIAYLAGTKTTSTNESTSTELTPGEVTPGFAMGVIPHILDRRRVILQCSVSLSSLDKLVEFSSNDQTIQLPQMSTRSFAQQFSMNMGETLVLGGFEQESATDSEGFNLLSAGGSSQNVKRIIVITVEVESAGDLNA